MECCSRIQDKIGQLQTVIIILTWKCVITRHTCNRCIYLLVNVIFDVVACTITFFINMYLLSPFFIIFWWLWTFCDHVIFRYISKAFPRHTFSSSIVQNINRASFSLFLSLSFWSIFCRVICISTKCALCLNSMCSFTIPTKTWAAVNI